MKRQETVSTFNEGLVMDFNPLVTPKNTVTSCLNGTLITHNGNENVLQNDMGNGIVETACLPEGYVPLGTAELGGIIYIVSYNPLTNQSQIGSFPSPERNITSDEVDQKAHMLKWTDLFKISNNRTIIKTPVYKLALLNKEINPGDKFQIYSSKIFEFRNQLSAWNDKNADIDSLPRYLKLHVVSMDNEGKITFLDNNLVWQIYEVGENKGYYYIRNSTSDIENQKAPNEYRDLVNSEYNVFVSKSKGTLAILAELECIDTFDVTWDANVTSTGDEKNAEIFFNLNWTYQNDNSISRNKVNLNKVLIERTRGNEKLEDKITIKYPVLSNDNVTLIDDTDVLRIPEGTQFLNPAKRDGDSIPNYLESDPKSLRKNDGTDNDFMLEKSFSYTYNADEDDIVSFTIIPGMPFGYMDYLKKTVSLNLKDLGTGKIDLVEWRYLVFDNSITLNWGLDCYPEKNKKVNDVIFNFYELDNSNISSNIDSQNYKESEVVQDGYYKIPAIDTTQPWKVSIGDENILSIKHTEKTSFSGHTHDNLVFSDKLKKDKCYLVVIKVDYTGSPRYFFRFLYTTPIFNSIFNDGLDFAKHSLSDVVKVSLEKTKNDAKWTKMQNPTYKISHKTGEYEGVPVIDEKNYNKADDLPPFYSEKTDNSDAVQINTGHIEINADFELKTKEAWKDLFSFDFTLSNPDIPEYNKSEMEKPNIYYSSLYEDLEPITSKESNISETFTKNGSINSIHYQSDIKISTPFKSFFNTNQNTKIDYELRNLEVAESQLWFAADDGNFQGVGNGFPETGESSQAYDMVYGSQAKNLIGKADITLHHWGVNQQDGLDGFVLAAFVMQGEKQIELGSRINSGNGVPAFFNTYAIKGSGFANFIVEIGETFTHNNVTLHVVNQPYIKKLIDNYFKWVKSNKSKELWILNNLVLYDSYNFSSRINSKKICTINNYQIGNCVIKTTNNLPKNLKLNISNYFNVDLDTGTYSISNNALKTRMLQQSFITYLLPDDTVVSKQYNINKPFRRTDGIIDYVEESEFQITGRKLILAIQNEQLIVLEHPEISEGQSEATLDGRRINNADYSRAAVRFGAHKDGNDSIIFYDHGYDLVNFLI